MEDIFFHGLGWEGWFQDKPKRSGHHLPSLQRSHYGTQRQVGDKTDGVKGESRDKRKTPQISEAEGAQGFVLECVIPSIRGRTVLCH